MEQEVSFQRVINYNREGLDREALIKIYAAILKPRMIEEKMMILLR